VRGAFSQLWNTSADDQVASVYAEIAWRHGWLRPDRVLTAAEYDALAEVVTSWQGQDRSRSDVLAAFGPPSIGREGSPRWPKTLFYVTESAERPCVSFHFWNQPLAGGRAIYSEPALLAIRFERPDFADSFTFTPLGRRYLLPTYA
jgi:hypothetical protein